MCPVLLLLLAALNPESTAAFPDNSTGQKFFIVYPENIAYYHPVSSQNRIRITALHDNTRIGIRQYTYNYVEVTLNSGDSNEYILDSQLELSRSKISNASLQITSNNDITVHAISVKNNSMQTALVIPADKLGTTYLIPPIPVIPGTTDVDVTELVTERAPFRLMILNQDQTNTVTVSGSAPQVVQLQPNQTAQIWLQQQDSLQTVTSTLPVAVLFGHSCAMRDNCTCGLLYTMLPPAQAETQAFLIPPVPSLNAYNTQLLVSGPNSIVPFNQNLLQIDSATTVILYSPGLLLPLIGESDFASCFIVNTIPDTQTFAVIIVNKDYTDGVYVGQTPLPSPQWDTLQGTNYVWTQFNIVLDKNFIWHNSYTMAVYFGGTKVNSQSGTETALFGNPAPVISKVPDCRGCLLTPEVLQFGEVALGWRESVQYCKNRTLELISFSNIQIRNQIYQTILKTKNSTVQDMWIGMRRSSQTGDWYWLSGDPVTDTDWGVGEPGDVEDGQCTMMSQNGTSFPWHDEDCCKNAYPICYSKPTILSSTAVF